MTKEYRQQSFSRPAGATEVLLVRHGESRAATAEAPFPLVDGHGDPELHPNGQEQARRVARRLGNERIAAVYVTNLRRTVETAAPLCNDLGITPIVEPDLREVYLGAWEGGVLRIKAHENDPVYQRLIAEQRWDVIPGGESWTSLNARVTGALARIAARHPNELVVAVVHGGVIAHIIAHATGARPFAFNGADNGSISHIVLVEDRIVVRRFNDSSHLTTELVARPSQMT
jgi:probable phosphoglycerate mutase